MVEEALVLVSALAHHLAAALHLSLHLHLHLHLYPAINMVTAPRADTMEEAVRGDPPIMARGLFPRTPTEDKAKPVWRGRSRWCKAIEVRKIWIKSTIVRRDHYFPTHQSAPLSLLMTTVPRKIEAASRYKTAH